LKYTKLLENTKGNKTFIVEINGEDIKNMDDYISIVRESFHFPQTGHVNYYAYLDWIRDLDWLDSDAYIFAIRNFNCFMEESPMHVSTAYY
jgi:hypothetical protein